MTDWQSGDEWLEEQERVIATAQELQELQDGDLSSMSGDLVRHHTKAACSGRCPIHAPTDHPMVSWPMKWREDRRFMVRVCKHGVDHPDPDDLKVRFRTNYGIHSCDGCCGSPLGIRVGSL